VTREEIDMLTPRSIIASAQSPQQPQRTDYRFRSRLAQSGSVLLATDARSHAW
jgi:hypothetical protein